MWSFPSGPNLSLQPLSTTEAGMLRRFLAFSEDLETVASLGEIKICGLIENDRPRYHEILEDSFYHEFRAILSCVDLLFSRERPGGRIQRDGKNRKQSESGDRQRDTSLAVRFAQHSRISQQSKDFATKNKGAGDSLIGAFESPLQIWDYFIIPSTASFAAFATRNFTTVLAGI